MGGSLVRIGCLCAISVCAITVCGVKETFIERDNKRMARDRRYRLVKGRGSGRGGSCRARQAAAVPKQ